MAVSLVNHAEQEARKIVAKNVSKIGLAASVEGYPQVWARDANITFLGAALDRKAGTLAAFRTSLETLAAQQDRFGQIPYLVHIADGRGEFGSSDANVWFVIGCGHYAEQSGDKDWIRKHADAILRALDWCEAQDLKKRGLMISGECVDWADLIANHGCVLFPNVLYAHALAVAARVLSRDRAKDAKRLQQRHAVVVAAIQRTFWVDMPGSEIQDATHEKTRARASIVLRRRPFFLPWVDGFAFGERFDVTGNLLAVATGLATAEQAASILDYVRQAGLDKPYPVRVLHPPILPGEADWREYYKIFNLNLPDQYHNGGIWPWVGGLYVATLVVAGRKALAKEALASLAEAVKQGSKDWEFNEWLHGRSGVPVGARFQAWSAGMFLYAAHAVRTGKAPGLALV